MGKVRQLEEFKVSLNEEVQMLHQNLIRINDSCFMAETQLPGLKSERNVFYHKISALETDIW